MTFIYTLALENNKYYVGKTSNPNFRIEEHFNSNGSEWTRKYRPLKLLELVEGDNFDEDKYTIKYMTTYGINNVRGGSFCEIDLSQENRMTLQKMMDGTTDKCYICGSTNHFANQCSENYAKKHFMEKRSFEIPGIYCYEDSSEYLPRRGACYRCGRYTHYANECYANTHKNGYYLP